MAQQKQQFNFKKAVRTKRKLRLALIGPSGTGKTFSALKIATEFGGRIAVIDTEASSACEYANHFEFDHIDLENHDPRAYCEVIHAAEDAGYDWIIVDSLSHAWMGRGGALEQVDKISGNGSSFNAWRAVTPMHNALVDALVQCKAHLICTIRAKTAYAQEKDERTGKTVIRKLGMEAVQRDGLEYEFSVSGDMTQDHRWIISKTRCPETDGKVYVKPGKEVADVLKAWYEAGEEIPAAPPVPAATNGKPHETPQGVVLWDKCISLAKSFPSRFQTPAHVLATAAGVDVSQVDTAFIDRFKASTNVERLASVRQAIEELLFGLEMENANEK